ncbi:MAG: hypothetical protein C4313_04125 [Thermoflexus sp.]|uniref:hypothetical protein n=1 Tax=Thermoflexus sp. TaxID=1969742 RepID=UPI00331E045F
MGPLAWLAWATMAVGYWAPWIDGGAAGLTFSGFDLVPFLVFFQRAGYGPLVRERLWAPVWALAGGLALLVLEGEWPSRRGLRWVLFVLAALAPLISWPPYPELLHPLSVEGRGGFLGGLMAMGGILTLPLWPSAWRRRLALALPWGVLGLTGPELVQTWRLWTAHLGLSPALGWGLPLYTVGLALWLQAWRRTSR